MPCSRSRRTVASSRAWSSECAGSISRRAALRAACRGYLPERTLVSVPSSCRSAKFRVSSVIVLRLLIMDRGIRILWGFGHYFRGRAW